MAPRGQATAMLKETLVQQFGTAARPIIEAELECRLTSKNKLDREDLDAIERNVFAASRQRRTSNLASGGGTLHRGSSRSTPALTSALDTQKNGTSTCSLAATAPAAPPAPSRMPPPPTPLRQPPPSSGMRQSTSATVLGNVRDSRSLPNRQSYTLKPPFGQNVTDVDDAASERSCVRVNPKYPIPARPKLKPMDHWDLIVAYDSKKYRQEQMALREKGKQGKFDKVKNMLDGQMEELRTIQEQQAEDKRRERAEMLAQVEENGKLEKAEFEQAELKREQVKKATGEMMEELERREQRLQAKKRREQEEMAKWLNDEKRRQDEELQAQQKAHAEKVEQMKREMEIAYNEKTQRKLAQQEEDRRIVVAQERAMDDAASKAKAGIQKRMERVDALSASLGAKVAERDHREQRELEEKIKKVQEESERAAVADQQRRQDVYRQNVQNMMEIRARQIQERNESGIAEREEDKKQVEVFRQQLVESNEKERQKLAKARKDRENLDTALIGQIRENLSIHPQHQGMTVDAQKKDLAYNRLLFEQMSSERFRADLTSKFLARAADRGGPSQDPFPSVGHYEGEIHPLELQAPGV